MKEYKQMWSVNSDGDIEELAVSMITKAGWIKYYPVENGKIVKRYGLKEIGVRERFYLTITDSFEKAKRISVEKKRNILNKKLEYQEERLNKVPEIYNRIKQDYLESLKKITEIKQSIETNIKELKEQIKELEE